jgi:TonB-linked SusC/RagA family outer membrane protein
VIRRYFTTMLMFGLLLWSVAATVAQGTSGRIVGVVTDEDTGRPLPGVQIYLDGTTIGTLTGNDGRYVLAAVRPGTYTVIAQIIGHAQGRQAGVVVATAQSATVDFKLRTAVLSLQEVVVTGVTDPIAGVKSPMSIGKITRENIAAVPSTGSAVASIQGKVAGASIVRGSGMPGNDVNILLRSPTSIQQGDSNSPLFVVDGVILANTIGRTTVDIESLDIESIEVVKGAAAASLYGSKAAAGVIAITTSRGKNLALDETRITMRSEYGASSAPEPISLSRAHNYRQSASGDWLDVNGNVVPRSQRAISSDNIMDKPYTLGTFDNIGTYFQPARFLTNTVNLSHNSRYTSFMTSFNQSNERGALATNEGFTRRDFRLNLDHRLRESLSLAVSAYHSRTAQDLTIQNEGEGGIFWDLMLMEPDVDVGKKDANGNYLQQPDSGIVVENPLWRELIDDEDRWRTRTLGSIDLRFSPLTWLNFSGNFSYDRSDTKYRYYEPKGRPNSVTNPTPIDGELQKDDEYADALNASVSATLLRNFGRLTTRTTLRGAMEKEERTQVEATGEDFYVYGVPDLTAAATRSVASQFNDIRSNAYSVNTGIDYDGRYIVDALVRRDGSSLFGPDERWHTYYRAAAAWRLSSESFWPWKDKVNEFKLRTALGTSGNRPSFAAQYEVWTIQSSGAISKTTLGNRDLKPEQALEVEAGIDMIFANRFSLELTHAWQRTADQLIQLPLQAVVGYPAQWVNTGVQSGRTYEATFQAQLVNRPGFSWNMSVVADRMRSKIQEWNRSCFVDVLRNVCAGASLTEMWGEHHMRSMNEIAARHPTQSGEFQINDDGYVVWVGASNSWREGLSKNLWGTTTVIDGRSYGWGIPIVHTDEQGFPSVSKIGNSVPDLTVGWLNNFNWRGFGLHSQIHAQLGGATYNATKQRLYQHQRSGDLDQTGKSADKKKTLDYYQALYNAMNPSQHFVEPGGYLKLRELSLTYRLNRSQLARLRIPGAESMLLGLVARNLLTVSDYSGFDPEVGTVLQRRDYFNYPNPRQLTINAEITF